MHHIGIEEEHPIGRRCYELFHQRTVPCSGCPALEEKSEPLLATFENESGPHYYKVRLLPQNKIFELSRALLVIQDVTKEAKVMFDTLERLLQLAEYRDDDTKIMCIASAFFPACLLVLLGVTNNLWLIFKLQRNFMTSESWYS